MLFTIMTIDRTNKFVASEVMCDISSGSMWMIPCYLPSGTYQITVYNGNGRALGRYKNITPKEGWAERVLNDYWKFR